MRALVLEAGKHRVHLQVADQIRFTSPYVLAAGQPRPHQWDHVSFEFEMIGSRRRVIIKRTLPTTHEPIR
ncbi:MAG: hypothetical protein KKA42_16245 [candidate division Zixibacteria bacterium]|nr:hypothetical protein [candidate division Zixibacteria bacterium]